MSSPRPILEEMPEHIKMSIFENIPSENRPSCRLVCTWFKTLLDQLPFTLDSVAVSVYPVNSSVDFRISRISDVTYTQSGEHVKTIKRWRHEKVLENSNFMNVALDRLNLLLKVPKMRVNDLEIDIGNGAISFQERFLSGIHVPIECKELSLWLITTGYSSGFLQFLSLVNLKSLQSLDMGYVRRNPERADNLKQFVELGIFKNLKSLKITFPSSGIRLEDVKHLEQCDMFPSDFTVDDFKELKRMCLEDGKVNFRFLCKRIVLNTLTEAFGPYTSTRNRNIFWSFSNSDRNCCFEIRAFKETTVGGISYGCQIDLHHYGG